MQPERLVFFKDGIVDVGKNTIPGTHAKMASQGRMQVVVHLLEIPSQGRMQK